MLICERCGATDLPSANAFKAEILCDNCIAAALKVEPEVCDFCSTPEPTWGFPTRSFTADVPIVQIQDGVPAVSDSISVEDWAACDVCHTLILDDNHPGLLTRALNCIPGAEDSPFSRFALKGLHAQFFANRSGPPYRHALRSEAGCWVDGHWGQYGMTQVIAIARAHGWVVDQDIIDVSAAWIKGDPNTNLDTVVDIADKAENWLNEKVAPVGFHFGWHDGEFWFQPETWWEEQA